MLTPPLLHTFNCLPPRDSVELGSMGVSTALPSSMLRTFCYWGELFVQPGTAGPRKGEITLTIMRRDDAEPDHCRLSTGARQLAMGRE